MPAEQAQQASVPTVQEQTQEAKAKTKELEHLVQDMKSLRFVGMDNGPVPRFALDTVKGAHVDSSELVGVEPFLFFFFATWCDVCDKKAAALRRALVETGPVKTILVSLDGPDTWRAVDDYLDQRGLDLPLVQASKHPRFAVSYNPFVTVPLVVVVGKNGGLVDYQLGYENDAEERLVRAVELARTIGPLVGSVP